MGTGSEAALSGRGRALICPTESPAGLGKVVPMVVPRGGPKGGPRGGPKEREPCPTTLTCLILLILLTIYHGPRE